MKYLEVNTYLAFAEERQIQICAKLGEIKLSDYQSGEGGIDTLLLFPRSYPDFVVE